MQPSDFRVRRAQPADWILVRDLRLAALEDTPEAFASTLGRELGYPGSLWRERIAASPWFLAFRRADPVGLVAAIAEPGEAPGPGWHLVSMWVRPEVRGAGVADLLVGAIVQHARQERAARVTLWVAVGNERARAFYARMGFVRTGRQQVYGRAGAADLDEVEYGRLVDGPRES